MMNASATNRSVHEVGESVEADFETNHWVFHMEGDYRVSAGRYAILPVERHEAMVNRLEWATRILRSLCDTETKESIGPKNYERVQSFFDPEPLA